MAARGTLADACRQVQRATNDGAEMGVHLNAMPLVDDDPKSPHEVTVELTSAVGRWKSTWAASVDYNWARLNAGSIHNMHFGACLTGGCDGEVLGVPRGAHMHTEAFLLLQQHRSNRHEASACDKETKSQRATCAAPFHAQLSSLEVCQ
jgi:hypothetical protein